jgi:hypothetical protein
MFFNYPFIQQTLSESENNNDPEKSFSDPCLISF